MRHGRSGFTAGFQTAGARTSPVHLTRLRLKPINQNSTGTVPCLNPKGIPAQSPRLPRSGYLGLAFNHHPQPQRGCGQCRPWRGNENCHNRVAVDDFVWTLTQGRLADSPTLGFGAQSLWDCHNVGASDLQDAWKVLRPGWARSDRTSQKRPWAFATFWELVYFPVS